MEVKLESSVVRSTARANVLCSLKPGFYIIVAIVRIVVYDSSDWRWKCFYIIVRIAVNDSSDGIVYFCLARDFDKNSSTMAAWNETSLRKQTSTLCISEEIWRESSLQGLTGSLE